MGKEQFYRTMYRMKKITAEDEPQMPIELRAFVLGSIKAPSRQDSLGRGPQMRSA